MSVEQVAEEKRQEIEELLQQIERQHRVRIVYACESGSRAWGFASPDSDYDIRFLFIKPEADYVSVHEGIESIDLPLLGLLDAGGWDVRKAAKLLGKSNGALLEWLHSPIVYRAEPGFRERWQQAAREIFFRVPRVIITAALPSKWCWENCSPMPRGPRTIFTRCVPPWPRNGWLRAKVFLRWSSRSC